MSSIPSEISLFIQNNKMLCAFSLGVAIAALSLSILGKRIVAWIYSPTGVTNRVDSVAKKNLWVKWNRVKIEKVVTAIKKAYLSSTAAGFVLQIGKDKKDYTVQARTPSSYTERRHPKDRLVGPPVCKRTCPFCKIKERKRDQGDKLTLNNTFSLVKSRSKGPLIINHDFTPNRLKGEGATLNWLEMNKESQIEMIQCAQKVVLATKDITGITIKDSYLELHCGSAGKQGVGHTHLRIHRLFKQKNPSDIAWNSIWQAVRIAFPLLYS